MARHAVWRFTVPCAAIGLVFTALSRPSRAIEAPHADAAAAMEKFLARPLDQHAYRASRRLEGTGAGRNGWLEAETAFSPASGFSYDVTAEGGSRIIVGRVLRPLLEEERRLIAGGEATTVAISPNNYALKPEGLNDDGLAVIALTP